MSDDNYTQQDTTLNTNENKYVRSLTQDKLRGISSNEI